MACGSRATLATRLSTKEDTRSSIEVAATRTNSHSPLSDTSTKTITGLIVAALSVHNLNLAWPNFTQDTILDNRQGTLPNHLLLEIVATSAAMSPSNLERLPSDQVLHVFVQDASLTDYQRT